MPIKKPLSKSSGRATVNRKYLIWGSVIAVLLLVGVLALWFRPVLRPNASRLEYLLIEKNEEQITSRDGDVLHVNPQDKLKILEIRTNVFNNNGIRLRAGGFDVNALLNDKLAMAGLLPQSEIPEHYQLQVEVKHYNETIGEITFQVELMVEDWVEAAEKNIDKNIRITILEKGVKFHPHEKNLVKRLLEEYKSQEKWLPAAKLLEEIAKDQPSEKTYADLLEAYQALKKADETITVLRRLLQLYPQNTAARTQLAMLLQEQKKYAEAVLEYETLLKDIEPAAAVSIYKTLGLLYAETGRVKEAIAAFLKAAESDKKDINLYYNLAGLYEKTDDAGQADLFLTKALQLKPDDTENRLRLADSLVKSQKHEEAEKHLQVVLKKDQKSRKAWLLLGMVMEAKKDKPGLRTVYRKILALDPANETVTYNLGVLEYELGDLSQAELYCKIFAKSHPEDYAVQNLIFEIYKKQKQEEAAYQQAQVLLDLKPEDPAPYPYIFDFLNRRERYRDMIPIMQKGLKYHADRRDFREYLILAFLKTGDEDQAIQQIRELLKTHDKDINLRLQLAKLLEKQEKLKEALDVYQRILDIDPNHAEAEEAYLRLKLEILPQKQE